MRKTDISMYKYNKKKFEEFSKNHSSLTMRLENSMYKKIVKISEKLGIPLRTVVNSILKTCLDEYIKKLDKLWTKLD